MVTFMNEPNEYIGVKINDEKDDLLIVIIDRNLNSVDDDNDSVMKLTQEKSEDSTGIRCSGRL